MKTKKLHSIKSTIVRINYFLLFLYLRGVNALGQFFPELGARLATRVFLTTRRFNRPVEERELLKTASRQETTVGDHRVVFYRWGHTGPKVLLVHGWNGRGTQLGKMVPQLLEQGFQVVTFDGIGHGDSDGKQSTIFDLSACIDKAEEIAGSFYGVITHSMGGPATTLSLVSGLTVDRLVYISPPYNPMGWLGRFIKLAKISSKVGNRMKRNFQERFGEGWRILHDLDQIKSMNHPLLVLHDETDSQVSWNDGRQLASAWPGAQFQKTQGLGHNRILKDESVVRSAVAFIAREQSAPHFKSLKGDSYEKTNSKLVEKFSGKIIPELQPDPVVL